jgi:hypothetical protein
MGPKNKSSTQLVNPGFGRQQTFISDMETRARIFKKRIDSNEPIPPGCVVCSLAGRYDNPIPTRFLAPIDCLKIPALAGRYDNPIPIRFLVPIDCLTIPTQRQR